MSCPGAQNQRCSSPDWCSAFSAGLPALWFCASPGLILSPSLSETPSSAWAPFLHVLGLLRGSKGKQRAQPMIQCLQQLSCAFLQLSSYLLWEESLSSVWPEVEVPASTHSKSCFCSIQCSQGWAHRSWPHFEVTSSPHFMSLCLGSGPGDGRNALRSHSWASTVSVPQSHRD